MAKETTLDELKLQAKDWSDRYEESRGASRIDAIFRGCTPTQLTDMWGTGRDLDGELLSDDQFYSLIENVLRVFGAQPTDEIGSGAPPLSPSAQAQLDKDGELDSIPDHELLTRKDTARLLGISVATLDRYNRDCEPIAGVLLESAPVGKRGVRYLARDVKAVRKAMWDQGRQARAARIAEHERYAVSGAKPRR